MNIIVTDEIFCLIVQDQWEEIAAVAYGGFLESGRGIVEIQKIRDGASFDQMEFRFVYLAHTEIAENTDSDATRLIHSYKPEVELVIRYQQSDFNAQTVLLKAPTGKRTPKETNIIVSFLQHDLKKIVDSFEI